MCMVRGCEGWSLYQEGDVVEEAKTRLCSLHFSEDTDLPTMTEAPGALYYEKVVNNSSLVLFSF